MIMADFYRMLEHYADTLGEYTPVCLSLNEKHYSIGYAGLLNGTMVMFELTQKSLGARDFLETIKPINGIVERFVVVDIGGGVIKEIHAIGFDADDGCITISLY